MFRRRRPLLRAAAVGGGAYIAGKSVANRRAAQQQQEDEQNQRLDGLEQQAPAAPNQPASAGATPSMADQLSQLATLHDQGALTDDEFAAAKARILGS
jgi:hypothetical protein